MGPHPHDCGNRRVKVAATLIVWLQWSHILSDVEMGRGRREPPGSSNSFNGATSSRIWKPTVGHDATLTVACLQ